MSRRISFYIILCAVLLCGITLNVNGVDMPDHAGKKSAPLSYKKLFRQWRADRHGRRGKRAHISSANLDSMMKQLQGYDRKYVIRKLGKPLYHDDDPEELSYPIDSRSRWYFDTRPPFITHTSDWLIWLELDFEYDKASGRYLLYSYHMRYVD
jgi:hypothetical protein